MSSKPRSREISVSIRTSPGGRSMSWRGPVRAPRAQPRRPPARSQECPSLLPGESQRELRGSVYSPRTKVK
jgi:hypothetical protein